MNADQEQVYTAASWEGLPHEILFDILSKLSIKTLTLCRHVCKSWFHTISDPSFIKTYNANSSSHCLLFHNKSTSSFHIVDHETFDSPQSSLPTFYTFKLPPPPHCDDCIESIYSCNGLLLLVSNSAHHLDPYSICNPITGDRISIPACPYPVPDEAIVWDTFGFGYDPTTQVSKVIWIQHTKPLGTFLKVYNVCTGKWKVMHHGDIAVKHCDYSFGSLRLFNEPVDTFVNGALHWIALLPNKLKVIVSFNLDTEEFEQLPLPSTRRRLEDLPPGPTLPLDLPHYLLALQGCLTLVEYHKNHVEIWVMEDYGLGLSWEKKYSIPNIVVDEGVVDEVVVVEEHHYKPIRFMQNGEILLLCYYSNELSYYHPVTKVFRPVLTSIPDAHSDHHIQQALHVSSLVPPRDLRISQNVYI